ncbi:uncharacterized protein LOC117330133 [Pecten maximus]|uniref:uncharacterized protein LOC117330133 n=1 Tax=Pecten maximus TaxID=6579 RepID=UPI001458D906|nr:uncharacterized protein LOC117330133 [Pecten maximus]
MTARQQSMISKVPRYAAMVFLDQTCGIIPTTKIMTGTTKLEEVVKCIWDGEEVEGKIVGLNNSPSELGMILEDFESRPSSNQSSPISSPSPPPKKKVKVNNPILNVRLQE